MSLSDSVNSWTDKLKKMQSEPASKEWFAKHGSPKSNALKKVTDFEKRVPHKATDGTLHFSHPKSQQSTKHAEHLKLMESRKKGFHDATINRKRD